MQIAARYAASIDILERILEDAPAEKQLIEWARSNRYAGSKDRAAIRDIVFDCLRNYRSFQHSSGLTSAYGLVVGRLLKEDIPIESIFSGEGYAPKALSAEDLARALQPKDEIPEAVEMNIADWMLAEISPDIRTEFQHLNARAPIDLRVNTTKLSVTKAKSLLANEGIECEVLDIIPNCLRVIGQTRKIPHTELYQSGKIELQDAGSQALVADIVLTEDARILDYCAGGGGKTLALAAMQPSAKITAFDINFSRMKDLEERAARAGASVSIEKVDPISGQEKFDFVIVDAPCSGSGAWRRNPDGKLKLTAERLADLTETQLQLLERTAPLVDQGGSLVYMTCSLFDAENKRVVDAFLECHADWFIKSEKQYLPSQGTDGFFKVELTANKLL